MDDMSAMKARITLLEGVIWGLVHNHPNPVAVRQFFEGHAKLLHSENFPEVNRPREEQLPALLGCFPPGKP